MAYGTTSDVEAHSALVAKLSSSKVLAKLTNVSARVDARLSKLFDVPFADPAPDLVKTATTMITAGELLRAHFQAVAPNRRNEAQSMIDEGWKLLDDVLASPSMLGVAVRLVTAEDQRRDRVRYVLPREKPVFGVDRPESQYDPDGGSKYRGV